MKNTRLTIFSMALALVLSACAGNASSKEAEKSSIQPKPESKIVLKAPEDTSMLAENVKEYIDAMHEQEEELDNPYLYDDLKDPGYVDVANFLDKGEVEGANKTVNGAIPDRSDKNMGVDLEFTVKDGFEADEYKVLVSLNKDMSDAKEFVAEDNKVNVQNLFVNKDYYWKVVAGDEESEVGTFKTGDYPR